MINRREFLICSGLSSLAAGCLKVSNNIEELPAAIVASSLKDVDEYFDFRNSYDLDDLTASVLYSSEKPEDKYRNYHNIKGFIKEPDGLSALVMAMSSAPWVTYNDYILYAQEKTTSFIRALIAFSSNSSESHQRYESNRLKYEIPDEIAALMSFAKDPEERIGIYMELSVDDRMEAALIAFTTGQARNAYNILIDDEKISRVQSLVLAHSGDPRRAYPTYFNIKKEYPIKPMEREYDTGIISPNPASDSILPYYATVFILSQHDYSDRIKEKLPRPALPGRPLSF